MKKQSTKSASAGRDRQALDATKRNLVDAAREVRAAAQRRVQQMDPIIARNDPARTSPPPHTLEAAPRSAGSVVSRAEGGAAAEDAGGGVLCEPRRARQIRAEAPAWRRSEPNDVDAPQTLGDLVCEALANGEHPRHFASAALEQLGDEHVALAVACEHEAISYELVAKMIWRLGLRVRAASEIDSRITAGGFDGRTAERT